MVSMAGTHQAWDEWLGEIYRQSTFSDSSVVMRWNGFVMIYYEVLHGALGNCPTEPFPEADTS
jgi:hypothetical protein